MSYRSLLTQRCRIRRPTETMTDGIAEVTYPVKSSSVPCRVDLTFSRPQDRERSVPEAGRPADRVGTAFFLADADLQPGDRIELTSGGVIGTFVLGEAVDSVLGRSTRVHHKEVPVKEVPSALAGAPS